MKETKFNQILYQNDYNKKKYDRINLTMPKGKKARIKGAAEALGVSVNHFLNNLIDDYFDECGDSIRQK